MRAKPLVIARRTFIYPILWISQNIQQVFYFEVDEHSLRGLQNSPIEFHKCIDMNGTYRTPSWPNEKKMRSKTPVWLNTPRLASALGELAWANYQFWVFVLAKPKAYVAHATWPQH